jgi:hypothetical protein
VTARATIRRANPADLPGWLDPERILPNPALL